jgi:hypothetical protein
MPAKPKVKKLLVLAPVREGFHPAHIPAVKAKAKVKPIPKTASTGTRGKKR